MTRADRLSEAVAARGLDALLVSDLVNVRYLTGYRGTNGMAIVGPQVRRFLTDFRYGPVMLTQVPDEFDRVVAAQDLVSALPEHLPEGGLRLGFDDAQLSVRSHARLGEALGARAELVAAGGMVEELRAVKEPEEVERISAAARLADEALQTVLERGLAGRTEREVAFELEFEQRRRGAEALAFPPIVASGEHGASPHATPRDVAIAPDVLVTIDWGAQLDGYCSDCTRTYATGEGIADEARTVYELVRQAQAAALAAVRPGPSGKEVDAVARDLIGAGGHAEHFGHALGHGVGLLVHEGPRLSKLNEAALQPGNIVTVEPGVYVPDRLGVRIEDLVAITEDGHRVLNGLGKDLQVV